MENHNLTVLLIEDNPGDARLIQEELTSEMDTFFEIKHVPTLREAKDAIENGIFDVIIADLNLPDSRGIETFEKVYEVAKWTPVVVLSSIKDETLAFTAVSKGAEDYLIKGEINNIMLKRSIFYSIERHKVKAALKERNELFKIVADNVNDLIAIVDLEGKYLYKSPSYKRLQTEINLSSNNENILNEIFPDDRNLISTAFQEIPKLKCSELPRYRMIDKSMNPCLVHSYASIVFNEKGNPEKIILISHEILEEKET